MQLLAIRSAFTRPSKGEPQQWNLALLTAPGADSSAFQARARTMANAVCSTGNMMVPATLIRALFDLKRLGTIDGQQLQVALQELVKARFPGEIPDDGMMRYLGIVGKAAIGPDERVSALKPLAVAMMDRGLSQRLDIGIGFASEYWPSWRKVDSEFLRGRIDQPEAPEKLQPEDARHWAACIVKQPNADPAVMEENLRSLARECGDDHLSMLMGQLHTDHQTRTENRITALFAASVPKRVLTSVLRVLLRERESIEQCIEPYKKLLYTVPKKSRLHGIAMDTLTEMLQKHGSRVKTKPTPPALADRPTAPVPEQPVQWHKARGFDEAPDYF